MSNWTFKPSRYVPFRDEEALRRCRAIKREDMDKHPNPDFRIRVIPDQEVEFEWVMDVFRRIRDSAEAGRPLVMILPNPVPRYRKVVQLLNACRVDCKHVYAFAMDEYANEDGQIAPETWPQGFVHAMKRYFLNEIDSDLRPPEKQFVGPTDRNANDYSKMIEDMGGADICYSGPGWTGHLAFIEPDAPEFDAPLEEWKQMGARIVTLSPLTLAQNSLHGSFGMSGDIAAVPPKAFTIGPRDVIAAKRRVDTHTLSIAGTAVSWQRMMTRLCLHGPVTPRLPTSINQELRTDVIVSENAARNIEPDWNKAY